MCGRDNPGHLVFCQECGQRLAPRVSPSATAAATSAPTSPLAATAASPVVVPTQQQAPPNKARPPAPEVTFTRRREPAAQDPALPVEQSNSAWPTVTCPLCGSTNQRSMRFCITCGQLLPVNEPGSGNRLGGIELMRTVVDAPKAESTPPPARGSIAPARVIDIGPMTPQLDQLFCPRCRGTRDSGAQFCRFCGLPLGTAVALNAAAPNADAAANPSTVPGLLELTLAAPSVAPQSTLTRARLVLITRDGTEGPSYPLSSSTDLGRIEGHILFPDDQYISPRHARIVTRRGAFFVRDLESANGVFVRIPFTAFSDVTAADDRRDKITMRGHHTEETSEPETEQALGDQELFLVGQQVLRFEVVKPAEEAFGAASENGTLLFGTPAAPRYARLSQRTVEGVVRDVFHVRRAETVIGRESGDIVFTDDPFLSRRHAVLRMQSGAAQKRRFTLADLGSSNGTFLRIREEVCLRHGDHLRIGQQLLRFDIDSAPTGL
jgi:pSer/pThr/pTyr-binding forkhead associated (FHA) protein